MTQVQKKRASGIHTESFTQRAEPQPQGQGAMEAAGGSGKSPKDLHSVCSTPDRRRQGSLAAAVAQCLSLSTMCTAGAYPSWVVVQSDSVQVVLGAAWALNPRYLSSLPLLLGSTELALLHLIALSCLLTILSSCGALLLDFVGPPRGRAVAPLLHGLAALFAGVAVAMSISLVALIRKSLRIKPELQPWGLSAELGPSIIFCIIAFVLAVIATGCSCKALVQAAAAASLCRAGVKQQQSSSYPTPEGDGDSSTCCFSSSPKQETTLPMAVSRRFVQGEAELKAQEGPGYKQGEIKVQVEEGIRFIHKETDFQADESLSPKQVEIQAQM